MSVPPTRATPERSRDGAAATRRRRPGRPLTPEPTHGQRRVLDCIRDHIRRTGAGPTLTLIQNTLDLASRGAAGAFLEGLRRRRLVRSVHPSEGRLQLTQADALPILSTAARSAATLRPAGDEERDRPRRGVHRGSVRATTAPVRRPRRAVDQGARDRALRSGGGAHGGAGGRASHPRRRRRTDTARDAGPVRPGRPTGGHRARRAGRRHRRGRRDRHRNAPRPIAHHHGR